MRRGTKIYVYTSLFWDSTSLLSVSGGRFREVHVFFLCVWDEVYSFIYYSTRHRSNSSKEHFNFKLYARED